MPPIDTNVSWSIGNSTIKRYDLDGCKCGFDGGSVSLGGEL